MFLEARWWWLVKLSLTSRALAKHRIQVSEAVACGITLASKLLPLVLLILPLIPLFCSVMHAVSCMHLKATRPRGCRAHCTLAVQFALNAKQHILLRTEIPLKCQINSRMLLSWMWPSVRFFLKKTFVYGVIVTVTSFPKSDIPPPVTQKKRTFCWYLMRLCKNGFKYLLYPKARKNESSMINNRRTLVETN